ncbi:ethanolamine ammonia-lyase subunit EutC [Methyloprofundus sp.]|uniref:ethanolamine ammonia-lyase subunit EutC n=1 Tax=Methyloprofundus sp. TaxID=2020875 RepID=UPI003D0D4BB0
MANNSVSDANKQPLQVLKQFTNARIALGRAGTSLPIQANLDFQLAHALARDAVSIPLDFAALTQQLSALHAVIPLQSQVENHSEYLQRPDKGRLQSPESREKLESSQIIAATTDIAIIVADGLSSTAIANHASALLNILIPKLQESGFSLAPILLARYARVAIGDPIGEICNAKMSVVLIGERPGLSSPDSMGIYFTYQPKSGNTDAQRNCISNIHSQGLDYQQAINKLMFLIHESCRLKISGVHLKDASEEGSVLEDQPRHHNFLLE